MQVILLDAGVLDYLEELLWLMWGEGGESVCGSWTRRLEFSPERDDI